VNEAAPLAGKVAIVTGSSKGIGEAAALALAGAGAAVTVTGRTAGDGPGSVGAAVRRVHEAGGKALGVQADITGEAGVARLFDMTVETFGGVDVLVNNAGVYHLGKPLAELSLREWDEMMEVNLRGLFLCCRAAVPVLARRGGGSIINLTSRAAESDFPANGRAGYAASKAGVERLTQILAGELAAVNIAVNALSPVGLRTPGSTRAMGVERAATFGDPGLIGPVIVHLAQQRAGFTGRIVRRTDFVAGTFAVQGSC
jgi:NAD(P)-dependent dehydrogenase (short-subunit alcohol dehydrogenase family)